MLAIQKRGGLYCIFRQGYKGVAMKRIAIFFVILALIWPSFLYAESQTTSSTLASTIIDQAREYLGDPTTYGGTQQSIWGDAEMLQYLNDGTMAICKLGALEDIESETLVNAQTAYPLTDAYIRIVGVVYDSTKPLEPGTFKEWLEVEEHGTPAYWMSWETGVIVFPAPNSDTAGDTIDVYVIKRPSAVAGGASVLVPAQYDSALVFYITAMAYGGKDGLINRAGAFMTLFDREMGQGGTP